MVKEGTASVFGISLNLKGRSVTFVPKRLGLGKGRCSEVFKGFKESMHAARSFFSFFLFVSYFCYPFV